MTRWRLPRRTAQSAGSALESRPGFRQTPRVLLDRVLANAANEVMPFAVCDVRRGVRVEMRPTDTPMLHCVARGNGVLWTTPDDATPLGEGALAIVPRGAPSFM